MRCVANATPGRFTFRNGPVCIVQEAGWVPGPVWTGVDNLRSVQPAASRYADCSVPATLVNRLPRYLVTHRADCTKYSVVVLHLILSNVF